MVHFRGWLSHSASTPSVGIAVCEKSYSRLLISTWIGSIGTNGRKALAPTTLNMLPKLELAAILMYLMMLPNTRRPSTTPCLQHQQAVLQQDDVGRLLGDVHRRVDRDAHVGGLERRRVVDAVAQEADARGPCSAARG